MFVALGSWRPDGWTSGGVEEAKLDAYRIGDLAHDAAEGVDFADEVTFGDSTDGRVAGHLRDEIDVEGEEGSFKAHAGGGHGGLASGVAGADYDYVEMFVEWHWLFRNLWWCRKALI